MWGPGKHARLASASFVVTAATGLLFGCGGAVDRRHVDRLALARQFRDVAQRRRQSLPSANARARVPALPAELGIRTGERLQQLFGVLLQRAAVGLHHPELEAMRERRLAVLGPDVAALRRIGDRSAAAAHLPPIRGHPQADELAGLNRLPFGRRPFHARRAAARADGRGLTALLLRARDLLRRRRR